MALQLRWVGESEMDRVAEVRMRCYAHSSATLARYREGIRADRRAQGDAFLLAEQDGAAVGTAASLSLAMWVRGGRIACQGIAYVGTIKTHRRRSQGPGGGVATQLMDEAQRRARDQQFVATALMPFRASFYEHFGYGTVETRHNWTIPMTALPKGEFEGIRFYEPGDRQAIEAARQRGVERGQCDVERPSLHWDLILQKAEEGFIIVDRPSPDGPVRGYLCLHHARENEQELLKVMDGAYDDVAALRRQFHFLGSLRDQYSAVAYSFPADFQPNWLLDEVQLPHRPVTHPTAEVCVVNRLQVRVLDHARFIGAMQLPAWAKGGLTVSVRETEGHESRFNIDFAGGHGSVRSSDGSADFECPARIWAAIVCGELPATQAVTLGLAAAASARSAELLDLFAAGQRPFCGEAF
jgi:predicted acetyltransferase